MNYSIIIPTRNRSQYLDSTLDSIVKLSSNQNDFEVIVCDNGSTDNTKNIINLYKAKIKNLVSCYDNTPGLHIGRHCGLKQAKGEILCYLDDDVELLPTWFEGIKESFKDPNTVLVGGKNLPNFESTPSFWIWELWNRPTEYGRVLGALSILDFGSQIKEINPMYVFGCNFSIRKKILLDAGGFNPDGMPQDLIYLRGDGESYVSRYIKENNLKAIYNPKTSVKHLVTTSRMTHEYFYKRAFNQGVSNSFTTIRANNGLTESKISKQKSISKLIQKSRQLINLPYYISHSNSTQKEKEIDLYTKRGFQYHQSMVKNHPELLGWVLKKDFYETSDIISKLINSIN